MTRLQRLLLRGPDYDNADPNEVADLRDRWLTIGVADRLLILLPETNVEDWLAIEASSHPMVVKALADLMVVWRLAR